MNKKEERKLKVGFFTAGGLFLAIPLHSKWGFGWILSLILGLIFAIALWISIAWAIENAFK